MMVIPVITMIVNWWFFAAIQCKITCTGTILHALIANLSPPSTQPTHLQPTTTLIMTTTTAASMDDNNDPPNDGHWKPMDLLNIQWEIQQTMMRMQEFFATLAPASHILAPHSNPLDDRSILTIRTVDCMTTINADNHPGPCTISEYLTKLHTPACFVPTCIQADTSSPTLIYLITHQPAWLLMITNKPHCQHMIYPCADPSWTCMNNDVTQPLLAKVLLTDLDHPPDHLPYIISIPQSALYHIPLPYPQQSNLRQWHLDQENHSLQMGNCLIYPDLSLRTNDTCQCIIPINMEHIILQAVCHVGNDLQPP